MNKIQIETHKRPVDGMGSNSPRYELHTRCCEILLAADDSLTKVQTHPSTQKIDVTKLVIYDLGKGK